MRVNYPAIRMVAIATSMMLASVSVGQAQGWVPTEEVEIVTHSGSTSSTWTNADMIARVATELGLFPNGITTTIVDGARGAKARTYVAKEHAGDPHTLQMMVPTQIQIPILSRSEVLTPYTPYQPEVSQGTLQVMFEYQTAISELTALPVSNASLYEGPSSVASAAYLAIGATKGRKKLVVSRGLPVFIELSSTPGYDRAGYLVLPRSGARARFVTLQTLLPLLALLAVSLVPVLIGAPGVLYVIGAIFLGLGFLHHGVRFARRRSGPAARQLLLASIVYLPSLFVLMVLSGAR